MVLAALYKAAKALGAAEEPRERWVDAEGVTRLPRAMREELRVCDGAHIWFLRGPERWEAWKESEVSDLFGDGQIDENAIHAANAAMAQERDGDPTMFAEAFEEVCAHVKNASVKTEPQIVAVRGLDVEAIRPHLNRAVEFMGARGTIAEHNATSSCMAKAVNAGFAGAAQSEFIAERGLTCGCWTCLEAARVMPNWMVVCPQCGNKRCPRATSHDNACSGSNEPGQDGSE
jgi:Zn finger protein HypA/HybF involved in hydrogenase expression